MQEGDIITEHEIAYINALEHLWDMLSDMIEGGRLDEADIPDDYIALVNQTQRCESARTKTEE